MPNNGWLRLLFILVLGQALILGQALLWPARIAQTLPWPATPLNARFVAALYCMGVVTALLAIFAPTYAAVRVSVVLIFALTSGLLVLTLPHLGDFTANTFPYRWVISYALDAAVTGAVLWRLRGRGRASSEGTPIRAVVASYATFAAAAGLVMLVAPSYAVRHWPWGLTPILAQVYSIFFLTFALGGWLVARDPRTETAWIYLTANLAVILMVIGVSVAYPERFKPGIPTWTWYTIWVAAACTRAVALTAMASASRRRAETATASP
jgi:hypothetical protein